MIYSREQYDAAVAKIAHTGEKKPSFDEWQKLVKGYQQMDTPRMQRIKRVQRITASLVKEVMVDESNKTI